MCYLYPTSSSLLVFLWARFSDTWQVTAKTQTKYVNAKVRSANLGLLFTEKIIRSLLYVITDLMNDTVFRSLSILDGHSSPTCYANCLAWCTNLRLNSHKRRLAKQACNHIEK